MQRKVNINEIFWILISRVLVTLGIVGMIVFLMSIFLPRDIPIEIASVRLLLPVSTSLGFIALSASILAIGLSISSGVKMKALTSLNFDEKMAMMTGYKADIAKLKEVKGQIEDTNMIEKRLEIEKMIEDKIEHCKYDLSAISHLITWAGSEEKGDLINKYVIKIIESNIDNYLEEYEDLHRDKYLKNICEMINIALKIDSNIIGENTKIEEFKKKQCSHVNKMRKR